METPRQKNAEWQLRILSLLLSVQFILGITLTTLLDYKPGHHSTTQSVFLIMHIVVGILLLALAAFRLFTSVLWRYLPISSLFGLASVSGAMIAGIFAAKDGSDVAVFLMALGFLLAFAFYGYSMSAISRLRAKRA